MTQNSVQHCRSRVACTVTRTAVVGGKRHFRLGFVFYTEKSSTPSVLAVLVLCLRSLAFVTVSTRPPRVCQIWLTRYGTSCVQEPSTSETAADVQLSIARLSNLTKRSGSLPGGSRHTETPAIVVRPRPSKSAPFFSEIPASDSARPSQVADRRRLFFKSSLRPLSDTLALWKQNQHCDEKGVSSRKDFRWYEAFLPRRGREN